MAWTWYDSKVIKIVNESPTTKRFWVEVDSEDAMIFEPGQFVTMDLPIHEKRLKRWRSYSIANAPDGTKILEFCIVKLEGGAASEYFFEKVEIGTAIRFKGPSGGFVLKNNIEEDTIVMICTGTGIAPFRSMLLHIVEQKKSFKNIHLIFGTRYADGILYQKEWEQLIQDFPNFNFSVALSRAEELPNNESWNASKGYIHPIYMEKYKEVRTDIAFYLCGWSNMIDDAVANLIVKMGYDKSQVHYELYG